MWLKGCRVLGVLMGLLLSACQKEPPTLLTTDPSPTPVLVFGDSLSAGYNINVEKAWPKLLEQQLQQQYWLRPDQSIANASISGETTEGGLARFQDALAEHSPTLVILELGANDGLRRQSLEQMKKNLAQMIDICRHQKITVVLVGVDLPPKFFFLSTEAFKEVYTSLSEEKDVVLVENILDGVNNRESLMQSDGLHPNEHGQLRMSDNIYEGVREALEAP